MFVGVGAQRVRALFKKARKQAPCILFIDEIDSVGVERSDRHSNAEDGQTLNALLAEMDGFQKHEGILVLAATNHPEKLDGALLRSGRFDRQIAIQPPRDSSVRKQLFDFYLKDLKVSEDVDTDALSKSTAGFTGADIAAVCNEAALTALMHEKPCVDFDCMEEAIDRKVFHGSRSRREAYEKDRQIVAFHEAGHAVMSYLEGLPVSRASIAGMTSGVGGAVFHEDSRSSFMTKEELLAKVRVAYAGRASEAIHGSGSVTTGASNDIEQATRMLKRYVQEYGFDDATGLLNMKILQEDAFVQPDTSRIRALAKEQYEKAEQQLSANYLLVEALAVLLLEKESVTGTEITELFVNVKQEADEAGVSYAAGSTYREPPRTGRQPA
jgi:cell division protease FtsH